MAKLVLNELRDGLIATCQDGDHWCCSDQFLNVCALSSEQVEKHIKKWWGNQQLWLDMIATEVAKALGAMVDLVPGLGQGWRIAVDSWLESAYTRATSGMNCPPARPMASSKAAVLVQNIVSSSGLVSNTLPKPNLSQRRPVMAQTQCSQCGKAFSQRLGKCPVCFPVSLRQDDSERKARDDAKKQEVEAKQAAWRDLPAAPVHGDVPWPEASEMMWCHGGSGGVILLKLPTGAICIKAESCTPGILFAHDLASALNVRIASMRVVPRSHQESTAIGKAVASATPAFDDHHFHQAFGKDAAIVMEYVRGCAMMGVPAHKHLLHHEDRSSIWLRIGRLMGFDILINNFDRLPVAWSNDGNLGNVMLGSGHDAVVGIDQSAHAITHEDGLRNYIARVKRICEEVNGGAGEAFMSVKDAIYNNTAIELSAQEVDQLREGCFAFLQEVASLTSSGAMSKILDDVANKVASDLLSDGNGNQAQACSKFVYEVACAVNDTLSVNCD